MTVPPAATAARTAWAARKPLAAIATLAIAFLLAFVLLPFTFALGALALVAGADQACASELLATTATDTSAVQRAASQRHSGPVGSALVAAFADTARADTPTATVDAAGPFRLPAAYAAGTEDAPGRWHGPQDPITGDPARDSRQVTATATRAVLRRLARTDAATWRDLRTADPTTDPAVIDQWAQRATDLFTAAFPHAPLGIDAARAAISGAAHVDAGGQGDLITGGVLLIGDRAVVEHLHASIGERAFGGPVRIAVTTADPGTVADGAWSDLAGADGIVVIATADPPTPTVREDLADATNADVLWLTARGPADPAHGIYTGPDTAVLLAALTQRPGAGAPTALCQAALVRADIPVDLATIVAPDQGAYVAIAYAQAQLGKAYSMAAVPPSTWDCSKLTAAAWAAAGVHLTALSYAQWDQVQPIPRDLAAPGDLVFWFRAGAHHVALIDRVDAGQIWITEAANPDDGVRRRALGGSWDDASLTGFGRVMRPGTPAPTGAPASAVTQ